MNISFALGHFCTEVALEKNEMLLHMLKVVIILGSNRGGRKSKEKSCSPHYHLQ